MGLITPHRTYLTITKTSKGRPDPGFSATDDDDPTQCLYTETLRRREEHNVD
jgi:hypothetical protein